MRPPRAFHSPPLLSSTVLPTLSHRTAMRPPTDWLEAMIQSSDAATSAVSAESGRAWYQRLLSVGAAGREFLNGETMNREGGIVKGGGVRRDGGSGREGSWTRCARSDLPLSGRVRQGSDRHMSAKRPIINSFRVSRKAYQIGIYSARAFPFPLYDESEAGDSASSTPPTYDPFTSSS